MECASPEAPAERILIAEDSATNRKLLSFLLKKAGIKELHLAANGEETVRIALSGDCDLILMDCFMPQMDGYQAATEIRRRENGKRHIPIIAITASDSQGEREKCLEAGMDDYLIKPIDPNRLVQALLKWLKHSSLSASSFSIKLPAISSVSPTLNEERMRALFGDDRQIQKRFLEKYAGNMGRTLTRITEATHKQDLKEAHRLIHGAYGTSASYGILAMEQIFKEMQTHAIAGSHQELTALLPKMTTEFQRVKADIQTRLP